MLYNRGMVRLTCPHCQAELEIDEAFRGSVCRCYTCGTLLSVPEGRKGREKRSDRPDAPGPSPLADEAGGEGSPSTDALADALCANPAATADEPVDATVTRTPPPKSSAGGRKRSARGRDATASPTATIVAFIVSVVTLLAVLWFALTMLGDDAEPTPGGEGAPSAMAGGIEEPANPFLTGGAQFFGVPITGQTIIVIDSSEAMRDFFGHARQAAALAARNAEASHALQVIAAREGELMVFPTEPMAGDELAGSAIERRLQAVTPGGGIVLLEAIERALVSEPEQVIIAARFLPPVEEMETIVRRVNEGGAKLAVVVLGAEEPEPLRLVREAGGTAEQIPATRLHRWYEEYLQQR